MARPTLLLVQHTAKEYGSCEHHVSARQCNRVSKLSIYKVKANKQYAYQDTIWIHAWNFNSPS
eukprot:308952-Pelagomonas_calceolata.AAC.5